MADAAFGERAIIHSSLLMRGEEGNFRTELLAGGTQERIFKRYGLA